MKKELENKYIYNFKIRCDGGARGNPGPAAIGVIIEGPETGKKEYGEYIGETTNNEAEYRAVIFALKKLKHLIGSDKAGESSVEVIGDSELVTKQLSGEFKVKEKSIQGFFMEIWNLKSDFGEVIFHNVPREQNREADRIVNQVLDKETNKLNL